MDPDLLLIFSFILVVLSIVFPFAYVMNKREHDHKERKLELQARAEEAKAEQARFQNGDYSRMEERVRVLEERLDWLACAASKIAKGSDHGGNWPIGDGAELLANELRPRWGHVVSIPFSPLCSG